MLRSFAAFRPRPARVWVPVARYLTFPAKTDVSKLTPSAIGAKIASVIESGKRHPTFNADAVRSTLFSIAISKQASADGARAVFDWFVSHHSPWSSSERKTVNLTPLNHLVESYCREGRLQDAVVLIQRQKKNGAPLSMGTMEALLRGCVSCLQGQPAQSPPPSVLLPAVNGLLKLVAQKDHRVTSGVITQHLRLLAACHKMRGKWSAPVKSSASGWLDTFARKSSSDASGTPTQFIAALYQSLDAKDSLSSEGLSGSEDKVIHVSRDKLFSKRDRLAEKRISYSLKTGLAVVKSAKAHGLAISPGNVQSLFELCETANDVEIVRDMFLKGDGAVVLSTSNLGPVVVSCVRCGALPIAYTILDSILMAGGSVDASVFTALVLACKNYSGADVNNMTNGDLNPAVHAITASISHCPVLSANLLRHAFSICSAAAADVPVLSLWHWLMVQVYATEPHASYGFFGPLCHSQLSQSCSHEALVAVGLRALCMIGARDTLKAFTDETVAALKAGDTKSRAGIVDACVQATAMCGKRSDLLRGLELAAQFQNAGFPVSESVLAGLVMNVRELDDVSIAFRALELLVRAGRQPSDLMALALGRMISNMARDRDPVPTSLVSKVQKHNAVVTETTPSQTLLENGSSHRKDMMVIPSEVQSPLSKHDTWQLTQHSVLVDKRVANSVRNLLESGGVSEDVQGVVEVARVKAPIIAAEKPFSGALSLSAAVSTATSLCNAVVEWLLAQLAAIEDGGSLPKSQAELLATLDMGQDLLMLAMAEWPVSEHMHAMREDFAYVHPMKKEALRIQQRLAALTHPQPSRTTIPSSTVATLGQTYPIDLEFVQARVGVWVPDPDFYTAAAMQYPADYSERVDAAIAGVIASSEAVVTADTSSEGRVWIRKPQWELASAVLGQQLRRASVDSVAPPKAAATSVSSTFAGWIGKATPSEDHNATAPTAAGVGRKAGQPGYRAGWHAATGERDDTATMAPQQ